MSDIKDFVIENGVLVKYTGDGGDVAIPESVTKIRMYVFFRCTSLTSVTIPEGLTEIGESAFYGCTSLTSVTIPEGVTKIGESAFYGCTSLNSVTIPKSVTKIGESAFDGCMGLTSVTILEGVKLIGKEAFKGCTSLTSVTIPESVTEIGWSVFEGCTGLTSVTIPGSVTVIESGAFEGCTGLTSVTIPGSVTKINMWAFKGCAGLTSVTVPESVAEIGWDAFGGCTSLTSMTILEGVKVIGNWAFEGCTCLACVTIPESVTEIGESAFDGCESLTGVIIPESVTSIGEKAFHNCSSLREVTLPKGLKNMGDSAFDPCCNVTNPVSQLLKMTISVNAMFSVMDPSIFNNEDVANLYLNKRSNEWRQWLREKYIAAEPQKVFDCIYETFVTAKKVNKTQALLMSEFIEKYSSKLSNQSVKKMMTLLEQKECPVLEQLRGIVTAALSGEAIEENPIEARVRGLCEKSPLLSEAKDKVKKGVPFAGSKQLSSSEVVAFILSEYAKEWKRCAGDVHFPRYNTTAEGIEDGTKIALRPEADEVAAALDRSALVSFLESLVYGIHYRPWMIAWTRFADDHSVSRMTSAHKTEIKGKASEFYKAYSMRESLLINETRAAMQFFDRIGELDRYAQMRGMTAMELRDSMMLPAFDFDADGVKRYDIGGNTIEVCIAPDLSFRLFDVNKQKEIRSFPKKSDDPAKAETCAKKFAAFKKEVLAFAKERTELLHRMHMSGEYVRADLWKKVYVEHPVISKLARLVVWQDEAGKTLMIADDGIIDSQNSAYAAQGKIRVAHVLDMDAADITAWQQWLAKRGCVQLFEQVWEPVIQYNQGALTKRYSGVTFTNEERNTVKKALKLRGVDMRAAEMDREYNHCAGEWIYSNEGAMLFGKCMRLDYTVDENTKAITFGKASSRADSGNREMNATLLEMDKATLSAQITRDNDTALTDQALSVFSAAQIAGLLNLAIDRKATLCTARLLDYKNTHFSEFAEVNVFSLDW